ncbi:hypothetical protein KIN20_014211 [Parelaphostrongylus tenuis]|uniref:Uncharacterized protein n=1 Tax=Parelaphostrongylus tenuis TaxID=148309 RepID=A0AAD5MEL5_PARTN|nr:hypothetical protein KIN20_014211 [Parelaphostrongylus tenuis]
MEINPHEKTASYKTYNAQKATAVEKREPSQLLKATELPATLNSSIIFTMGATKGSTNASEVYGRAETSATNDRFLEIPTDKSSENVLRKEAKMTRYADQMHKCLPVSVSYNS